jgi:integrase
MVLLDTARRIGEALHLHVEDFRAAEREIAKTQSKGRRPRVISVFRSNVARPGWPGARAQYVALGPNHG